MTEFCEAVCGELRKEKRGSEFFAFAPYGGGMGDE